MVRDLAAGGREEDEPEQEDAHGDDDAATQDMIDEPVPVLHFRYDRAPEGSDPILYKAEAAPGPDQSGTPVNARRTIIARPRPARKRAKANRTFDAFAFSIRWDPRYVPVNTPMITMAPRSE